MKTLIVYYSLSGNNEILANDINRKIESDIEEIVELNGKTKGFGIFVSIMKGILKFKAKIKTPEMDPTKYDLVIICTPAWMGNLPPVTRSFLEMYQGKIKKYAIASFSWSGENAKLISQTEKYIGASTENLEIGHPKSREKGVAREKIFKEYIEGECNKKINEFVEKIKRHVE